MFSGDKNQGCRGEEDHYGNGEDSPEVQKEHNRKRQQQPIDIIDQENPAEEDGADGD